MDSRARALLGVCVLGTGGTRPRACSHREHHGHIDDLGGVKAERLVECPRDLPNQ